MVLNSSYFYDEKKQLFFYASDKVGLGIINERNLK